MMHQSMMDNAARQLAPDVASTAIGESSWVDQNSASLNQIASWLRQLDLVRMAA